MNFRRAMACASLAAALLLAGCPDKSRGFVLVKNVCASSFECLERDAGVDAAAAHCDEVSLQCVHDQVPVPYRVVLQVRPKEELELVEQYTYPAFNLKGPLTDNTLQVPLAEQVSGKVSWTVGNETRLLESEVTFVPIPRELGAPVTATVVKTRGGEAAEQDNLQARLSPDTDYQMRVQPLLAESAELPPLSILLDEPSGDLNLEPYSGMESRTGQLVDEYGAPFVDHRVRLEDKLTGEVRSSTGKTGEDGGFELFALESVMSSQGFNVVVSLQAFLRWRVKLAIDGAKLVDGAPLVLPRVPDPVEFSGVVRAGGPNAEGPPAPHADVIFVSKFPMPSEPGDTRGADWCRWQFVTNDRNSPPLCSASIATTANSEGKFSVQLLPGRYEVFGVPSSQPRAGSAPLRTTRNEATVLIQDDGKPQAGQTVYLARAAQFEGKVLSYREEPMPNVTVTARSLAPQAPKPGREVYQYARSTVAVTDDEGRFHLDIDLGYFDLSAEPTAESGFAWVQLLNREIEASADPAEPEGPVDLWPLVARPPVIVAGRVMHEEKPLADASVEAFALIDSVTGGRRAVRIAQTTSEDDGSYRLSLPPEVRETDPSQAREENAADAAIPSSARTAR